jgi:hypothetical protein
MRSLKQKMKILEAGIILVFMILAIMPRISADPIIDTDNDGIPNSVDLDIDGDGINNCFDDDIDGDGIPNSDDYDADADGEIRVPPGQDMNDNGIGTTDDIDGDGIPNGQDLDIEGDGIENGDEDGINGDTNGDGIANIDDPDIDGDGIPNGSDSTPRGTLRPQGNGNTIGTWDGTTRMSEYERKKIMNGEDELGEIPHEDDAFGYWDIIRGLREMQNRPFIVR